MGKGVIRFDFTDGIARFPVGSMPGSIPLHADTGETLWETIVGGPRATSNITSSVAGRQYVAVITGDNLAHPGLNTGTMGPIRLNLNSGAGNNALYVFALPE